RGPLAGDVYAAAVILDPENPISGLNDSKKLSAKKRELLYGEILEKAVSYSIATASIAEIDSINILQATFLAMKRAVAGLSVTPSFALIDGDKNPDLSVPSRCLIKGDGTSASIAAASILAKVSRDHYMEKLDRLYPQYAFAKHKGYGTKLHYEKLDQCGASPVHRVSFLKKYNQKKENAPLLSSGQRGEGIASQYLAQQGYRILEVNYHSPYGEIDIIASNEEFLVFVEVKTRSQGAIATPREAVTAAKQEKLRQTALIYLSEHSTISLQPRFDIIEVLLHPKEESVVRVEQFENAFSG
ncbi:MAG: ribonuclease HII, partial [Oscillospiraceae bacterium]